MFTSCFAVTVGIMPRTKPAVIYRELGLPLRNKTPKRRVKAKLRDDRG